MKRKQYTLIAIALFSSTIAWVIWQSRHNALRAELNTLPDCWNEATEQYQYLRCNFEGKSAHWCNWAGCISEADYLKGRFPDIGS